MQKLASLLLFEYLEVRKLADPSPAASSSSALFHGYCMYVSSSRRVFGLSGADVPARGAREIVFRGLECLSRLSSEAWEMMGPMKNLTEFLALETVSEKMQEERLGYVQKKSSSDPLDNDSYWQILEGLFESDAGQFMEKIPTKTPVTKLMDLNMVKKQLAAGQYNGKPQDFRDDVILVFHNVQLCYDDTSIHQNVTALKSEVEVKILHFPTCVLP